MRKVLIVNDHPSFRRFVRRVQAEGFGAFGSVHKDDLSGAALAAVME